MTSFMRTHRVAEHKEEAASWSKRLAVAIKEQDKARRALEESETTKTVLRGQLAVAEKRRDGLNVKVEELEVSRQENAR